MKKLLTIALSMLIAMPIMANQQDPTKKVAILDVVDREGNVTYGVELQLRSSLTTAITQTPGYEGYDRVDMDAVFGEHDFQRTGAVSDEQIKKLGEMSGCDYVLITEAAIMDERTMLLTAKVVNVTTGRIDMSSDYQIPSNAAGIRKGAQELAAILFGTPETEKQIHTININLSRGDNSAREAERNAERAERDARRAEEAAIREAERQAAREEAARLEGLKAIERTNQRNNAYRKGFKLHVEGFAGGWSYDYEGMTQLGATLSAGYMVIPSHLYVGAGVGGGMLDYWNDYNNEYDTYGLVPIFGQIRYYVLKSKVTPYVDVKAGYYIGWDDIMIEPGVGVAIGKFSIGASINCIDELFMANIGFSF